MGELLKFPIERVRAVTEARRDAPGDAARRLVKQIRGEDPFINEAEERYFPKKRRRTREED